VYVYIDVKDRLQGFYCPHFKPFIILIAKPMQRLIGAANYCGKFIKDYSALKADLHEMTKADFS
jgi:hypothetical protein